MPVLTWLTMALTLLPKTVDAYNLIKGVFDQHRVANDPEWDAFEARFNAAGFVLHDTSKGV